MTLTALTKRSLVCLMFFSLNACQALTDGDTNMARPNNDQNISRILGDFFGSQGSYKNQFFTYTRDLAGVCAVYHKKRDEIIVYDQPYGGISAAYNPERGEIETATYPTGGVALVYNPSLKLVERRTAEKRGIAGVYNPILKFVEFREAPAPYHSITGYFDPLLKEVKWLTSNRDESIAAMLVNGELQPRVVRESRKGVSLLYIDGKNDSHQSCSFYGSLQESDIDPNAISGR